MPPSLFGIQAQTLLNFRGLRGPEGRAAHAKTMRRLSFLGPGGPLGLRIADCGMRIEKKLKNPKSEMEGPMLCARAALPS
ncbi:MAG: hypothetical protein H6Q44_1349, partial [Deltaproteobacteria bacterium]|nr:hypothetical protein [Deltaproteobacteria bacterium]